MRKDALSPANPISINYIPTRVMHVITGISLARALLIINHPVN